MGSRKLTDHFTLEELACHSGMPVPEKYYDHAKAICERAEVLRADISNLLKRGTPLRVNSGYRTAEYNHKVGGANKSYHMTASALDLSCRDMGAKQMAALYEELIASGKVSDGGLGTYPREDGGWIHIDLGPKRRWVG